MTAPIPERHPDRSTRTEEAMSETPAERAARVERMHEKCARRGGGSMADVTTLRNDVRAMYAEYDRVRAELDARIAAESADAAAGSYAGRAEEAEAEVERLRAANNTNADEYDAALLAIHEARDHWQERAVAESERAERAEAALAELRERLGSERLEWSVLHVSGRDEPLTEANAHRLAAASGARLQNRVTGEWRDADATARTTLERAADEQGVPLVCDVDKLTAPKHERLSDEEWTAYARALGIETGDEQGDGEGGGA